MSSSITPAEFQYYERHASDNRQPKLIATAVCGLVVAYVAVVLRLFARAKSAASFGIDDWLIVAALLPLTAYSICAFLAVHFGEGRHIIFVTSARSFIEQYVTAIVAYSVCVVLTKSSILCFYNRIFPSQRLLRASWMIGAVVFAYNIGLILVTSLECIPLSSLWTGEPARCINTLPPFTTLAVINVVTDILILGLPIKFVYKLRMRIARKVQVCGIFLLGGLVCVFGIVRCVALATVAPTDQSYTAVYSGIWSNAEIAVGILAACLPTLGILLSGKNTASSWSRWLGSSKKPSNKTTGEISLPEWPKQSGYQNWSDVGTGDIFEEHASVGSLANLRESDHGRNVEITRVPASIRIKHELDQTYGNV